MINTIKAISITTFFFFLSVKLIGQVQLLPQPTEAFSTHIFIEKDNSGTPHLVASIILQDGSYVVSPFSTDTIYGHLSIGLKENDYTLLTGPLSESPIAKEVHDTIIDANVKFVTQNTRYKQELQINTDKDFQSEGELWFLLEPQCVPYKITYMLSQQDGVLAIENIKTSTDY